MNNIIYDDLIIKPENDIYDHYNNFTKKLSGRDCVKFSLFCAKYVNPNTKESNLCIELVEKYLLDKESVAPRKLYAAYYNAYASHVTDSAHAATVTTVTTVTAASAASTAYAATNAVSSLISIHASNAAAYAAYYAAYAAYYNAAYYNSAWFASAATAAYYATASADTAAYAAAATNNAAANINIINKYLQILLRETKQFQNNKILEQISKVNVDKLELVDWNMITDIMQEEYNIIHEFNYEDIFSRRCLIELLRREY